MSEILRRLLADGKLRKHRTSLQEVASLFGVVERDLADAAIKELSSDRRFTTAYEAALNLSTITLYAEGYETYGAGHHYNTFQALPELLGSEGEAYAEFFETCRVKRAASVYDRAGGISDKEAEELLGEARAFRSAVRQWLKEHHPRLLSRA